MKSSYKLEGDFITDRQKPLSCVVFLDIDIWQYDPFIQNEYDSAYYQDGVRAEGRIFVETHVDFKLNLNKNNTAIIRTSNPSCKFNVLLLNKKHFDSVPKQIRVHEWEFFVLGRPEIDASELWPQGAFRKNMNKMFLLKDPHDSEKNIAIVIAKNLEEAEIMAINELKRNNRSCPQIPEFQAIELEKPSVTLLYTED